MLQTLCSVQTSALMMLVLLPVLPRPTSFRLPGFCHSIAFRLRARLMSFTFSATACSAPPTAGSVISLMGSLGHTLGGMACNSGSSSSSKQQQQQ